MVQAAVWLILDGKSIGFQSYSTTLHCTGWEQTHPREEGMAGLEPEWSWASFGDTTRWQRSELREAGAHCLFYVRMAQRPHWLSQERSLNLCSFQPHTLLSLTRSKIRLSLLTQQHPGSQVRRIFFVTCVYVVCLWAGSWKEDVRHGGKPLPYSGLREEPTTNGKQDT